MPRSRRTAMQLKWYVLNIRPAWEKDVSEWLSRYYIEHYFPVQVRAAGHHSDGTPLFSSCMFIRASLMQQNLLSTIPGILCFRYWLGRPATIRDEEIEIIREFLQENPTVVVKRLPVNIRHRQRLLGNPVHDQPATSGKMKISRIVLPSIGYMILRGQDKPSEGSTEP